ncbi:MAG: extradiol ring-cleavage dioxygenase [Thermomicrobia bacterium]|nr:extradiol ring-cleavage dioxygenase [Thermomicrobia bacterium]MCA1725277.1 extradiol ring-cleavage dioxygenase [Thermomicrobia bacterium]
MSGLVFAAIAPHGSLAIPDACSPEERHLATATQGAMAELGRRFAAARPDATIIVTPHNVHVEAAMAVVVAGKLAGSLSDWTKERIELQCSTDRPLARAAIDALNAARIPAVGISYGGNDAAGATAPMDWGVLIPLWFMGGRSEPQVPVVVISPARDLSPADHVRAGKALAEMAATSGKRVAMIASSDHGHAHLADGPYGFDPAAAEYDNHVVDLIKANHLTGVREIDPALVARAKADSFWQMLMLSGAIGDTWKGEFLSYEAPTYFGMLCAAFAPV